MVASYVVFAAGARGENALAVDRSSVGDRITHAACNRRRRVIAVA